MSAVQGGADVEAIAEHMAKSFNLPQVGLLNVTQVPTGTQAIGTYWSS